MEDEMDAESKGDELCGANSEDPSDAWSESVFSRPSLFNRRFPNALDTLEESGAFEDTRGEAQRAASPDGAEHMSTPCFFDRAYPQTTREDLNPPREETKEEPMQFTSNPLASLSESSMSFPPVSVRVQDGSRRGKVSRPFDKAFEELLRALEQQSPEATQEIGQLRRELERLRRTSFRWDPSTFQEAIDTLEEVLEAATQEQGPQLSRRRPKSWNFRWRRKQGSSKERLGHVKDKLRGLMRDAYAPSPHGEPSTVLGKKVVQGVTLASHFIPIPGVSGAIGQLMSTLNTHLDAMANEGDYVADAKANLRTLQAIMLRFEGLRQEEEEDAYLARQLALNRLYDVMLKMNADVEEWLSKPDKKEYFKKVVRDG
eukprot:scaffold2736_cov164-Pinguiococcus_pyrenoidosus.AAC.1